MSGLKKTLLFTAIIGLSLVILTIAFVSPLTKFLVEKYDEQYTGRQITVSWAYVNPFTGFVHLSEVRILEPHGDKVFLAIEGISANVSMYKLLSAECEIEEIELNRPTGLISQTGKTRHLNFQDIIDKFKPDSGGKTNPPVRVSILNILINDGILFYKEDQTPVNYSIKDLNIISTGIHWNSDTIALKYSFAPGTGSGLAKGYFSINTRTLGYHLAAGITKFDLCIIEQYMKDLVNYGNFSANIDADIRSTGNFNNKRDVSAAGSLAINDFHFGKDRKEDYISFDKLLISIRELNPGKLVFSFDSIALSHPYLKYERYDSLDNLQTMFGRKGSKFTAATADPVKFNLLIEIGNYIKDLSRNFFSGHYQVSRFAIYNGSLKFNDYSTNEKFAAQLSPFFLCVDSIDENNERADATLISGIKPFGNLSVKLGISSKNNGDFNLAYRLSNVPASLFNPYLVKYTSFPLDRGTVELDGLWNVKNAIIHSKNHLLIIDPRIGTRVRNYESKRIPLKLLMFIARENGNVMDYDIPINGDMKNPKFGYYDVIRDGIVNFLVKPATVRYRENVKNAETDIERSMNLKWEMRSSNIPAAQKEFLEQLAQFLSENPSASISVVPQQYMEREMESILYYEAKKKYYQHRSSVGPAVFTESDSLKVNMMSVKDPGFVKYLRANISGGFVFTTQGMCASLVSEAFVNQKYRMLNAERQSAFMRCFSDAGVSGQVKVLKSENLVPFNGFSFYKLSYAGNLPDRLTEAYQKMQRYNNKPPRIKFRKYRRNGTEEGYGMLR